MNFQDIIMALHKFWAKQGCLIWQSYDVVYLHKISGDGENAAKYAKLAKQYDKFNPFYRKSNEQN